MFQTVLEFCHLTLSLLATRSEGPNASFISNSNLEKMVIVNTVLMRSFLKSIL